MKRYLIKETEETGSYSRSDNYLLHVTIRDNLTKVVSTPSAVVFTIYDPCDTEMITGAMTSSITGIYYTDYSICSTAAYGKWTVELSTTTYTQMEKYHFYIFPWDVEDEVRAISGIGQNKSISDSALNELIWESYLETLHQLHEHKCDVKPRECISTCSRYSYCINGSNTTFFLPSEIADKNGDGCINGWGEASCGTDVTGYYKDCDGVRHNLNITVVDAESGQITVTKLDGTAIETTAKGAWYDYWTPACTYSEDLFRLAVMYLASHKCLLRFGELERATSADLASAQNVKYVSPNRMLVYYKSIMKKIQVPKAGSVY